MQTKSEIREALQAACQSILDNSSQMSVEQFNRSNDETWSAAGYLKHLLLSVKPLVRALELPKPQLAEMFGRTDGMSMTYDELVGVYKARLAEGIRAEDTPNVTPLKFRIRDDVTDEKAYLLDLWEQANHALVDVLNQWSETELDQYQLPHPAIKLITVREMLFFTVYHNQQHGQDMFEAAVNV